MHLLKIIHGYPPDFNAGSEVYSQSICSELSKTIRVSVFTREENIYAPCFQIRKELVNENLTVYCVNNPQGKDGYLHAQLDDNFAELVKELQPDIAHIGHLNHLSTGIVDVLDKLKTPIVFTLHDFWLMCPRGQFLTRSIGEKENFRVCEKQEDRKCASDCYRVYFNGRPEEEEKDLKQWSDWVNRRMWETKSIVHKVDRLIAPSKYLMNRFINDFQIPKHKIQYLDYGFPTSYLKPVERISEREFTFGYIGTHIPAKGVNILVEAFSKIDEPSRLKIFGRNRGKETEALRKLATLSKNPIEFLGEYDNPDIAREVFSQVDCIVVPSIWGENSPLVIHEAQACKIPVITADFGGMKEYVQHLVNGLLFKHRDVDSLYANMCYAIQNPRKMKALGSKGYLYSEEGQVPSIEDHCKELKAIYKKEIQTKGFWRLTLDTNPEDCNLSCIMCEEHSPYSDFIPNLYKETGVKRRRMPFEMVENLFEQAGKLGVKEIIPSTMGEPLLYKQFDRIFDLAEKKGIKINLTTNGTFPKKSVLEWAKLIVPNTSDIKISWNAATSETAEEVMPGIDFELAIENVKQFISYRDDYHLETGYYCRVTFQLTFMQNNMHELADIIKLATDLKVDRVKGHHLWAHFDKIKSLSMKDSEESIQKWNLYVKEAYEMRDTCFMPNRTPVLLENIYPIESKSESSIIPEDYECPFLGKELWVSATGKISPCCAPDKLRQSLGDFGNVQEHSLEEVLTSANYLDLCENYKSNALCQTCDMRVPNKK